MEWVEELNSDAPQRRDKSQIAPRPDLPISGHRECYWLLQGHLSNPFTGDVIAAIRGVEVVRLVGGGPAPCLALEGTKKALQLSSPPSAAGDAAGSPTSQWRALASTLSAKSFRYFHPLTEQPLLTFRPSPRAKPRAVPTAVTSVQAVTYALSRQGHLQLVGESVSGGLLSVRDEGKGSAEAGSGSSTGGKKKKALLPWSWPPPFLRSPPRRFELSLLMWPGSKQQQKRPQGTEEGGGGGWGIPLSSLVQFGASSSQPPCRELYAFTTEPTPGKNGRRPRMRYLRYGECPYWCGAGRVCHLTLEGVRYDRFQDIPQADRRLFFPGAEEQPKGKAERGDAAVSSVGAEPALPALPLTMHQFSDEQEREKRRRRKRFFFF